MTRTISLAVLALALLAIGGFAPARNTVQTVANKTFSGDAAPIVVAEFPWQGRHG